MTSISIQGRIDSEVWEEMKQNGETNTQVLQRISSHYLATSAAQLEQIAPTPTAAIAVLLDSHRLLNQLMSKAVIAFPEMDTAPTATTMAEATTQHVSETAPAAAQDADNW